MCHPETIRLARGIDTCKLVKWGIDGTFVIPGELPAWRGRGPDYFELEVPFDRLEIAKANMAIWSVVAGGEDVTVYD
jgi:hypothetical protein